MSWKFNNDKPIFLQIMDFFKLKIINGEYKLNEKLPSVRDFAKEASVNPNTMQKALSELERENLIYSERTSGRYVTNDENIILELKKDYINELCDSFILKIKSLNIEKGEILKILEERMND